MPKGGKTKKAAKPAVKKTSTKCCLWTVENMRIFVTMICVVALFFVAFTAIYAYDQRCSQKRAMLIKSKATVAEVTMPVAEDDKVYLTTYGDKQGLLLNGAFYSEINKNTESPFMVSGESPEILTQQIIDGLSKQTILTVAPKTIIYNLTKVADRNSLVIVLVTESLDNQIVPANVKYADNLVHRNYAVIYDLDTKAASQPVLLSESNIPWEFYGGSGYALFKSMGFNENQIVFSFYPRLGVDGYMPDTLLVDVVKNRIKNIGQVTDFKWIGEEDYNYKEYIERECNADEVYNCWVSPETLAWKKDRF